MSSITNKFYFFLFCLIFALGGRQAASGADFSGDDINVGVSVLSVEPPSAPTFEITVYENKAYFVGEAVFTAKIHILITRDLLLITHAITISDDFGNWSYITDVLPKGEYDVVVYAVDAAERVSPNAIENFEIIYEEPEDDSEEDDDDDDDGDDDDGSDEEEKIIEIPPERGQPERSQPDFTSDQPSLDNEIKKEKNGDIVELCPPEGISKKDLFFSDLRLYDLIMATWYLSLIMLPLFIIFLLFNKRKEKKKDNRDGR